MKGKKLIPVTRGLTALMATLLAVSTTGYAIANSWRSQVDAFLGTESYVIDTNKDNAKFKSEYKTIDEMIKAAKEVAIKEGREGTVLMKNDNALPLKANAKVALFGLGAYTVYPNSSGDLKAGNADAVDLKQAFKDAGFAVNEQVANAYESVINKHIVMTPNPWTGQMQESVGFDFAPSTAPGNYTTYQIKEISADMLAEKDSGWSSTINKSEEVGIVVFSRPAGEQNMYKPGSALNTAGEPTGKDPLALSDEELAVVDMAKAACSKVVVLLNTGNAMEIGAIAKGGAHEADGIAYIGCPNDYQSIGIVEVLAGKYNATGALTDTYAYSFTKSMPAVQNMGGSDFVDKDIIAANATNGYDPRFPNMDIPNSLVTSTFNTPANYSGAQYIVEAEGIYVGYKYYETRYYDSIANTSFNANSTKGSSDGSAWNYDKEVVYTFGHGLSYFDYEQNIEKIEVDKSENGKTVATVAVHNKSNTDATFTAQLYFQAPYTAYDKDNLVEKAAVNFLNSKKVDVKAGATERVTIEIPTKYLASYDYKNAKTYILDEGDYYFTAAAGAHEAVNNILAAQSYNVSAEGKSVVWNGLTALDRTTFATQNGVAVTNQADNADLNYYLPGTVTYLTRQNWETFPINYNDGVEVSIGKSEKKAEFISALRGTQHEIATNNPAKEGEDKGKRLVSEQMTYDILSDINNEYWNILVSQISIDEAIGAIAHGGSRTEAITNVSDTIVLQNEGVSGFTTAYNFTEEDNSQWAKDNNATSVKFNIHSQTLISSSFNPELALEWGRVEGNSGLWLDRFTLWGTGLTLCRTPYNGRNYEYISEDPMLTNVMGYGILGGCLEYGILNGPKHIGCNDQEYNRGGIAEFMTEQKLRETDLRGFQGGLEDAKGLAVMVAFNRIGATNATHHVGMLKNILRGEWAFNGLMSTDMVSNKYYFYPEAIIMTTVTQMADFSQNDFTISASNGHDKDWAYLSVDAVKGDAELVEAARQALKYQLYAFANSAILNISTVKVTPWWETAITSISIATGSLTALCGLAWIALTAINLKDEEDA